MTRYRPAEDSAELHWDSEHLFFDGDSFFDNLLADLAAAQFRIDLLTYIFMLDVLGEKALQALEAAAQRGVRVRVILDGVGSMRDGSSIATRLERAGADIHIYHPLPWQLGHHRWNPKPRSLFDHLGYLTSRMNRRQHSKLCVIDNAAWVGSLNITADHLSLARGGRGWKDCGVRVTGTPVQWLEQAFRAIRERRIELLPSHFLRHPMTNLGHLLRRKRLHWILLRIHSAQHRIWITTAYFSPIGSIARALKKARRRGVDVQVLVPRHSDVFFFPLLSSTYYADLLAAGIRIHEYLPAVLHAKNTVIDNTAIIGSANLNHRSPLHDVEMDVMLSQPDSITAMAGEFLRNRNDSEEITVQHMGIGFRLASMLGWIPRLLRHWL